MKVLVTGAAGLLGTELCLRLVDQGYDLPIGIDNLSRYQLLGEWGPRAQEKNVEELKKADVDFRHMSFEHVTDDDVAKVDAVVHCAAQVCHSRKGARDNPFHDLNINVLGTTRLLDQASRAGVPFLFIGSSKLYGENMNQFYATSEACPIGDQTHITFFGASKAAADLFCQMYAMKYGSKVGVFRPGCFTGKWALATEGQNWLPWLIHCAKTGKTFNVFGDGEQVRDLLHVSDLARACIKWLEAPKSGVWNLGGGIDTAETLNQGIERVEVAVAPVVTERQAPRAGDIRRLVLDYSKFERDYQWRPRVALYQIYEEAVREHT